MASHQQFSLSIFLCILFHGAFSQPLIRMPTSDGKSRADDNVYCESWRLAVETNNTGYWEQISSECISFVMAYMRGELYLSDSEVVANFSREYAYTVEITGDGKDVWIFDVDETLLSNLPPLLVHGVGGKNPVKEKWFDAWMGSAEAPALPASLSLYNELLKLNFTIILLTGREEDYRNALERNLVSVGYNNWERLIMRNDSDRGKTQEQYKSERRQELVDEGFRLIGNSGDQWSDLLGFAVAKRSFKLPNPMYYAP